MNAQDPAYARLRRALDHNNLTEALSAAADLPQVGLVEALELVLLCCDRAPEKYERAALRWHLRFCRETTDVTLADSQATLALLALLPTRRKQAAHALSDLLYHRGLERACEALNAWATMPSTPSRPAGSPPRPPHPATGDTPPVVVLEGPLVSRKRSRPGSGLVSCLLGGSR